MSLTLTNKFEVPEDDQTDVKTLVIRLVQFGMGRVIWVGKVDTEMILRFWTDMPGQTV